VRRAVLAAALALFAISCIVLWRAPIDGDVVELHRYGHAVLGGQVPYRDFALEYPPGAIPLFTLPALGEFVTWFRLENALAWAIVIALTAALLETLFPRRRYNPLLTGFVAAVPLVLGPFALMRFDAWATVCVLGALLLHLRRRPVAAMTVLALGTLVKAWPLGLVPVFLVAGVGIRALAAYGGVLAAGLAPFVALSAGGSYNGLMSQVDRHLEFESLGASLLFALGRPVRTYVETGSISVAGSGADSIASLQSLAQLAAFLLAAVLYARSRRRPRDLARAVGLGTAAAAVLGKVLSPQYLLWLAPFAVLVDSVASLALFAGAAAATHPLLHDVAGLAERQRPAVALLAVRNALLLALTAVLLRRAVERE
jgi:hypothetical protein